MVGEAHGARERNGERVLRVRTPTAGGRPARRLFRGEAWRVSGAGGGSGQVCPRCLLCRSHPVPAAVGRVWPRLLFPSLSLSLTHAPFPFSLFLSVQSEIVRVRDALTQTDVMRVPESALAGHAFHTYRLTSPDGSVSFEFQHNVCGRTIYAEGTVDAALFLASKVAEGGDKRLFDMVDVLGAGAMR